VAPPTGLSKANQPPADVKVAIGASDLQIGLVPASLLDVKVAIGAPRPPNRLDPSITEGAPPAEYGKRRGFGVSRPFFMDWPIFSF